MTVLLGSPAHFPSQNALRSVKIPWSSAHPRYTVAFLPLLDSHADAAMLNAISMPATARAVTPNWVGDQRDNNEQDCEDDGGGGDIPKVIAIQGSERKNFNFSFLSGTL